MNCKHMLLIAFLNDPKPFFSIQLNSSKKCDVSPNNSFKHRLFVYTQLNDQRILFQTIQFSMIPN